MSVTGSRGFSMSLAPSQAILGGKRPITTHRSKATGEENLVMIYAAPIFDQTSGELVRVWVNFASNDRVVADIGHAEHELMEEFGLEGVDIQIVTGNWLNNL